MGIRGAVIFIKRGGSEWEGRSQYLGSSFTEGGWDYFKGSKRRI